jgi:CspA family cold shock protein
VFNFILRSFVMSGRETGRVKWFNDKKGFGFIARANGEDIFVHYNSIQSTGPGRRTLRENEQVEFVPREGQKGWQAEEVKVVE